MSLAVHKKKAPRSIGFGWLTVSDSRSPETDRGALLARELIEAAGHRWREYSIVADEIPPIQGEARAMLGKEGVEIFILSGGTGVAPRDVTPQAVSGLLETELPGFGELFRSLSHEEIGSATILSRALGGICGGKPLFVLPGSTKAIRLGLEKIILPEAGHILAELRRTD